MATEPEAVDSRLIEPVSRPVTGTIRPPGSKSITNRALVVAALAEGPSVLRGMLASRDTEVMFDSLGRLGIHCSGDRVTGCGGRIPASSAELYLENSGTSIRFLTATVTLGVGSYRLDGNERMRQRPIADLVEALNQLGAGVSCAPNGCPPVIVQGDKLAGGRATVRGNLSSQYLSALLMAAPGARTAVELAIEGELVSRPYVEMTIAVMRDFGVSVASPRPDLFVIEPARYRGCEYEVEPDASAASYFFAAAAITGGRVTVQGLSRTSLQGDVGFVEALRRMGCEVDYAPGSITVTGRPLHGIDIDMNPISDTAQTLAVTAVFAAGPTRIRNVEHMRHKETDRVSAVVTELRKMGIEAEEWPDGLTIHPGPPRPASIATYDDHRMAMSFALAGLRSPGIRIEDPGCTRKTYPGFWDDLDRLCGASEWVEPAMNRSHL